VKEPNISIYFLFPPITQWCSVSDVLFTGEWGVSDFSVLKYYLLNINYSVNILNECICLLIDCSPKPITTCCLVHPSEIVTHNAYISGHFRRMKISRKASDAAENLRLYRVVRLFHLKSSCTMTHISADVQRITLNASCLTISGERTKQLDIFCHVTGFTSDFLSFIVVELIRFFHGAIQLLM